MITRRKSIFTGGAITGGMLIPGSALGANEKISIAFIGVGARGNTLLSMFEKSGLINVAALCDVDLSTEYVAQAKSRFPKAHVYDDWRKLFDEKSNEFDAVMVMVPDHSHFPITMTAMALGKHCYTEKPLARTFEEIALMTAAAKRYGVVTQMGNSGFSGPNYHQFKAWKAAGVIKDVTHIDAFINISFPWYGHTVNRWPEGEKTPGHINWDVWLGTTPERPYSKAYARWGWRGWQQYGTGAFGDWGAHIFDSIHHFLELGMPERIEVKKLVGRNDYTFSRASTLRFSFPERNGMPALTVDYYDGRDEEDHPPEPPEFSGRENDYSKHPGKFIFSNDLTFFGGHHSTPLQVIPYDEMRELLKAGRLPKDFGHHSDHYANFLLACKGEEKTRSPFEVGGPLSQFLILGSLAQRIGEEGQTLKFDRDQKQFTNSKLANALLSDVPRKGWEQYYTL